jgi:hypothetical protein
MGGGSSSASSGCTTHSSAVGCTPQETLINTIKVGVEPDGRRLDICVLVLYNTQQCSKLHTTRKADRYNQGLVSHLMGGGSSSASSGCTTHSSAVSCTPQEKLINTIKV